MSTEFNPRPLESALCNAIPDVVPTPACSRPLERRPDICAERTGNVSAVGTLPQSHSNINLRNDVYRELFASLYGLTDGPRRFRVALTRKLRTIGWHPLISDPSILIKVSDSTASPERQAETFESRMGETWPEHAIRELRAYPNGTNGTVIGVLTIHVDDLKASISPQHLDTEVKMIRDLFPLGKECRLESVGDTTEHVGMRIEKCRDGYKLDQCEYAQSLEPLEVHTTVDTAGGRHKHRLPPSHDTARQDASDPYFDSDSYARLVGQLLWLANSRPDIAFRVSRLASKVASPSNADAQFANSTLQIAKAIPLRLHSPSLKMPLRLVTFPDSSLGGNSDGTSQGGYCTVLTEASPVNAVGEHRALLFDWRSQKLRRVCHSTLSAELLVLCGGVAASSWNTLMLTEMGLLQTPDSLLQPSLLVTDAKSVQTASGTMNMPRERNLVLDLHRLRQQVESGEVCLRHVSSEYQLPFGSEDESGDSGGLRTNRGFQSTIRPQAHSGHARYSGLRPSRSPDTGCAAAGAALRRGGRFPSALRCCCWRCWRRAAAAAAMAAACTGRSDRPSPRRGARPYYQKGQPVGLFGSRGKGKRIRLEPACPVRMIVRMVIARALGADIRALFYTARTYSLEGDGGPDRSVPLE
eukprot:gene7899-biopygen10572